MPAGTKKHSLAILALNDFVPFDLSIPYQIFSLAGSPGSGRPYEVCFAGPTETAVSGNVAVTGVLPLQRLGQMDTVIVPGIANPARYAGEVVLAALRAAADKGVRLASICTGAWVLAAAGVLDGLAATTHWELVDELAKAYPQIAVEPDILFTDNGQILTSAGLSSGIDLCLHMVRKDCGALTAGATADYFVVPLEREGGYAQCIRRSLPQADASLAPLQLWIHENLHTDLTLQNIAAHACMSVRTLSRKFQEQTGTAPIVWLTKARIRRAQSLLESSALPVEQIATATGFSSATALRAHFRRIVGVSPVAWRKTYGTLRT